ncbi:MAG: hypothetical protein ACREQM_17385 [Candidatus Dormibacteraceae bacterium]
MPSLLSRVAPILLEAPAQGKLAYCLFRDRRVSLKSKAALVGTLGLLLGPFDLPDWVPLAGQMESIPLALLAVRVFIDLAPENLVREQRAALHEQRSVFDEDWRTVTEAVRSGVQAFLTALRRPEAGALPAEPQGVKRP